MANLNLPFESLLSSTGLGQLKQQLDQILANPQDAGIFIFDFLKDQTDLPLQLPVTITKEAQQYIIVATQNLPDNPLDFLIHDLASEFNRFELKLNEAATEVEEIILEAESQLNDLRDRVSDELAKIPYSIEIRDSNGSKEFFINQTGLIEAKLQGVDINVLSSSLTFTSSELSQLACEVEVLLPELKAENGVDPHKVELSLTYENDIFTGVATAIPAARLQGIEATISQLEVVVQNGQFQTGTQITGDFVFEFLDDGQNGPGKIDFEISLRNNGDVLYEAQNPSGQELKKGSVSVFFEQIQVTTHTSGSPDVLIKGWAQLPGVIDSTTQLPSKINYSFSFIDPHFEFSGSDLTPIPLVFSTVEFETVFLRIHKNGSLIQSDWNGNLSFPLFSEGDLDFSVRFEDEATDRLEIEVNNPGNETIGFGGLALKIDEFKLLYENSELQNILGSGELTLPVITTGEPIAMEVEFERTSQNEIVRILANDFGTPELAGCQIDFSKVLFRFINGSFTESEIKGRLKLPDSGDGSSLAFDLLISEQGNDYSIILDGTQADNQQNFGPIGLAVSNFELRVVANQLQSIEGSGAMQLPGLNQAFDFDFNAVVDGSNTIYSITINNVEADLSGFKLTFTEINFSSQGGQQFSADATGNLVLPVFDEGEGLNFSFSFDRNDNYQVQVNSGADLIKFGDFELNQVQIELVVQAGVLQSFTGNANLLIPGFESQSEVSVAFLEPQDQYLIELKNPLDIDFFGGELNLSDLEIEIRNDSFQSGSATGVFKLPDATGGAGIQFDLSIGNTGRDYTIVLTGSPDDNVIEFGPVVLKFESFSLQVQNGDVQSVSGGGSLFIPGLSQPFDFAIQVITSGSDPVYLIELSNVTADLASFQLNFDQIRIESKNSQDFSADLSGNLNLPAFDGSPIEFDLSIGRTNSYSIAIDGEGQSANFGIFVLKDLAFSIEVVSGQVQDASGSAGFHIPELTESNQPFEVEVEYSKNGNEDFALSASNLPAADLAIFTLNIVSLSFLVRNGAFESGNLSGSVSMPFFSNGGTLEFAFAVLNAGDSYSININSVGTLEGNGLEIKDLDLSLLVSNGGLQEISGQSKFRLPAGEDFVGLEIEYFQPDSKLTFSASDLPTFSIGGLTFEFSQFGFSIQNGNLVDASFAGSLEIPACDPGHNELDFNFELSDGNDYTIQANPGSQETQLKLGDVTLFISEFDLRILNGDLESISAQAGLGFSGLEEEDESSPARVDIGFSYTKATQTYQIEVTQDQKISIGGFAFTLKQLQLSFTPSALTYPFNFSGELEIPGLEKEDGGQAVVGVNFAVPSQGNFTGSLTSDAVFVLGSVKITVSEIEVSKSGDQVTIKLKGQLELEEFSGMGGDPAVIAVDIEIDSEGAFHVLGEVVPSTNAIKVIDVPSVVRIYLNKIGLSRTSGNDWDFSLGGLIENQIVIPGMDDLLPSQLNLKDLKVGSEFDLDLDIRWPSGLSISFGGGASEALIPVNGKFGSAVSLDAIKISYKDNGAQGVDLGLAFSGASIALGPVAASVEGLGINAVLTKPTFSNGIPQGNANFGIVNIEIEFKPPTGLGVSLDTPVFTGGGYLFFDKDKGEYAGAVELSFMNLFAVSAIGIINSKMPDGKPGTSVLFIVSVEFGTGIALGFGFFLSGLGGILGIHRTIQVERLRDGVRSGTIQNILFPKDIIANINKILTDIKEVFPVKRDQFVLGPMAAITWGVPTILRVDLGVVIEFANPVRFGILGVLRVILPDENAALIKIQVAFLGMIDFEKGMLSFDASLFDSKVLTFGLEGDMVLRIGWGAKPDFVLSVGGFHPRFSPPTHLEIPTMKRLTLKILSGNPRLTLTCYFAVTSNTVQFGAGIDFYFGVAGFKIVGEFGFDVLFQFSPFRFIADARAKLAVKAGSTTILSLSLEFSLEGPTPWRAKGTAKFKILFFSVKAKFDVTWGDKRDTTLPNIEVFPLLIESMEDIQNWRSVIGNPTSPGLRMKGISADEGLILTPNGTIEINQKVVPLEVVISKFGQFTPSDFTEFEVVEIKIGTSLADYNYIKDDFAPANFLDLGDNEKLSLPSFNQESSGVQLAGTDILKSGNVSDREVEYEQLIMDEEASLMTVNKLSQFSRFTKLETTFFSRKGAISKSKLSPNRSRMVNPNKVVLKKPEFSVVNTDNLTAIQSEKNLSYMKAVNTAKIKKSSGKPSIQVVASDILAL